MIRPTRWQRVKAAISQLICVVTYDGDEDEMLSSLAYRTQRKRLIATLDFLLGENHCKESYEWERQHYNVDRFK
jgi:hypothetical protein